MESAESIPNIADVVGSVGQIDQTPTYFSALAIACTIGLAIIILILIYKVSKASPDEVIINKVYKKMQQELSFLEVSKKRYSVRNFSDKKIDDETLGLILESGRISPTAKNAQPQRIYAMRTDTALSKINNCAKTYGAPIVILVCADLNEAWVNSISGRNSAEIDASIVTTQMMNEATYLGVDSVWICAFDENKIKSEFNLPENILPVNILAIGYATETIDKSGRFILERKKLNETVKIL